MTYAQLTQDKTALESRLTLSPEQYAALTPWKQSFLRVIVTDALPVPSATQRVVEGVPVIEALNYRLTWALIDKTQAELDADAQAADMAALKALLAAVNADIAAGITAAPTTAAQAFVEIQDLKRRALRTDRVVRWLIKQQG